MGFRSYNKIAKNSIYLYIKLFLNTIVGLYVSRIVLLQLGAESFGLFIVVGGIVSMINFLNETLLATTNRFISVELGKGEKGNINTIFNTSFLIHLSLAFLLIISAEFIGIWYIENHLNVSFEKIEDAKFILHASILATVFSIISLPFQGLIISREKFLAKSIIEIIGTLIKFFLVLFLIIYVGNKLRFYAIIISIVTISSSILFIIYCWFNYKKDIHLKFNRNIGQYKKMISFSGWIVLGTIAQVGRGQGSVLIINLFFGAITNAAFAIANQVYGFVMMFVHNLNQAAVPHIMESQSAGKTEESINIVYKFSKYVYFLMLIFSLPILMSIDVLLDIWLKDVPKYSTQFTSLMIINGLIASLGSSLGVPVNATGDIRKSQIWYSITLLSILPIGFLLFKIGYPPYIITVVTIFSTLINVIIQSIITAEKTVFNIKKYLLKSILPVFMVTISILPVIILRYYFDDNLLEVLLYSILSIIFTTINIYFIGLDKNEKKTLKKLLVNLKYNFRK